jgi:hypothetical protein
MKNNTHNIVIFSILIILIVICVLYDNTMEGFFMPPVVNSAALNSRIASGITSTSRMANTINMPKMNNNMSGGGSSRVKSAHELMQSERKFNTKNGDDNITKLVTSAAAVGMVSSANIKPIPTRSSSDLEGFENQFPNQGACLLPLPLSNDVGNGETVGGLQFAPKQYKLNGKPDQFDMVEQQPNQRYPLFVLP